MRVEPYRAEHLALLDVQEGQKYLNQFLDGPLRKALENEFSFTAFDEDRVVACAGLVVHWDNRALAWAYLADNLGPRLMLRVHRAVKRFLDVAPFDRIEATVDVEFEQGHRWMDALGFKMEARLMEKYRPDGGDSSLYARVR